AVEITEGAARGPGATARPAPSTAPVTLPANPAAAFALTRLGDGAAVTFTATAGLVGGVTVVTLSGFSGAAAESGSLADGRYALTVLASQVSAGGQALDGNGDGVAGDDYPLADGGQAQGLYRLFGDTNGDRTVDGLDQQVFKSALGSKIGQSNYVAALDFNSDGVINRADNKA